MAPGPDPLLCTLPPSRHGLPREFVEANQRQRIFAGMARTICEAGYLGCTVAEAVERNDVAQTHYYLNVLVQEELVETVNGTTTLYRVVES